MFFRRIKPEVLTFDQRVSALKSAGYKVEPDKGGAVKATRNGYGAILKESDGQTLAEHSGLVIGIEVGRLTNGGYQMFFRTPSGVTCPAHADQLKALHSFQEDLRDALGEISFYNQGLGTTTSAHLYDRVEERDHGVSHKAWQK